jgi:hypothetical protein
VEQTTKTGGIRARDGARVLQSSRTVSAAKPLACKDARDLLLESSILPEKSDHSPASRGFFVEAAKRLVV